MGSELVDDLRNLLLPFHCLSCVVALHLVVKRDNTDREEGSSGCQDSDFLVLHDLSFSIGVSL